MFGCLTPLELGSLALVVCTHVGVCMCVCSVCVHVGVSMCDCVYVGAYADSRLPHSTGAVDSWPMSFLTPHRCGDSSPNLS